MGKLSKDEIERWITLDNGVHVPIKKGETEEDVKKIFSAIEVELRETKQKYQAKSKNKKFEL